MESKKKVRVMFIFSPPLYIFVLFDFYYDKHMLLSQERQKPTQLLSSTEISSVLSSRRRTHHYIQ